MTMLRLLLVVVVLANVAYFAWSRGALAAFDLVPASMAEREPQRMGLQVRPDALQIKPAATPQNAQ